MFLLIILFGLAALGLALALYIQADAQHLPPPPNPPRTEQVVKAQPPPTAQEAAQPATTPDTVETIEQMERKTEGAGADTAP